MSRDITEILDTGAWKGHRCFIIAGGPSVKGLSFSEIDSDLTIGVNKSFTRFNTDICYCMDMNFYNYIMNERDCDKEELEDKRKWQEYTGIKVFLCPSEDSKNLFLCDNNIYHVKRLWNNEISFDLSKGIYGGNNSGFGALMLAIALGANPIYLLGFDMQIVRGEKTIYGTPKRTHWHTGYKKKQPAEMFSRLLERYREQFCEFAPAWKKLGVEIINVNTVGGTALKCFPIRRLTEVK